MIFLLTAVPRWQWLCWASSYIVSNLLGLWGRFCNTHFTEESVAKNTHWGRIVKKQLECQFHKDRDLCPVHCCIPSFRTSNEHVVSTPNIFVEESKLTIRRGSVTHVWKCCFSFILETPSSSSPLPALSSPSYTRGSRVPHPLTPLPGGFTRLHLILPGYEGCIWLGPCGEDIYSSRKYSFAF